MRVNSRVRRQRFELALDARQVAALLAAALAMLGVAFVLGLSVGRQAAAAVPETPVATRAALDHLDAPLVAHDEAAPELKAPQVLTDARPVEKTMPFAPARLAPTPSDGPAAGDDAPSPGAEAGAAAAAKPPPTTKATPARSAAASPAAGTATPSAATAQRKGSYTIQVASSSSRADAERIARRLAGRTPRIVTAEVPGKGRCYRVQVGSFPSPEAARKQLPLLARGGVHGIVVTARR